MTFKKLFVAGFGTDFHWRRACEEAKRDGWTLYQVVGVLNLSFLAPVGVVALGIIVGAVISKALE